MDETRDANAAERVDEGRREFLQGVRRWSRSLTAASLSARYLRSSATSPAGGLGEGCPSVSSTTTG